MHNVDAVVDFLLHLRIKMGNLYMPALNTISSDLNVSSAKINLSVTTYLIVQGVAPMMIAGFSDSAGRRLAYVICFTIYIAANLGLALQNNYAALMVLRCFQSGGSCGTVALDNGVVGDLVTSSERGILFYIVVAKPL
ncbi:major facilitator superfamily domain-containing protein [Lipomyces starkeyi]